MRIAIPLSGGRVSEHFGHSEQFLFVDADKDKRTVLSKSIEKTPEHAPGVVPKWLLGHQIDTVLAVRLGERARKALSMKSVNVLTGVSTDDPNELVSDFLHDKLRTVDRACDHSGDGCRH